MTRMLPPLRSLLAVASAAWVLCPIRAWAGPPFLTDDPEPVEYKHLEFYAATQWAAARHAASGTCPHVEVNYGALPGLQLHAIVPAVLSWTSGEGANQVLNLIQDLRFRNLEFGNNNELIAFPLVAVSAGFSEVRL